MQRDNAEIERYYLGPVLMAWTWLAILAGGVSGVLSGTRGLDPELDLEPGSGRPAGRSPTRIAPGSAA